MSETNEKQVDGDGIACSSRGLRMRPSRRLFTQTALACVAIPALPQIATPEMHFHSIGIEGDVAELFDQLTEEYDNMAWEIVPAYTPEQAIDCTVSKVRGWVGDSHSVWSSESEWEIRAYSSVAESEVVDATKDWGVSFDDAAGRLMGWHVERDTYCEQCSRYSMDQRVPTCSECCRCKPCLDADEPYYDWNELCEKNGPCPHCHWV